MENSMEVPKLKIGLPDDLGNSTFRHYLKKMKTLGQKDICPPCPLQHNLQQLEYGKTKVSLHR